jgi:hypothetical protein
MLSNVEGDQTDGGVPRYIFANLEQNIDAAQSLEGTRDERQSEQNSPSVGPGQEIHPGK